MFHPGKLIGVGLAVCMLFLVPSGVEYILCPVRESVVTKIPPQNAIPSLVVKGQVSQHLGSSWVCV